MKPHVDLKFQEALIKKVTRSTEVEREMTKIKKVMLLGTSILFLLVLVGSSFAASFAQTNTTNRSEMTRRHPPNPSPFDDMHQVFKNNFLFFIYNMENAGFSQGDVLYSTWSINHTASKKVFVDREINLTRNRSEFVLNRAKHLYNSTRLVNETLNEALATAKEVWNSTEFQNDPQVNRSTFKNEFLRFWLDYVTYHVSSTDTPTVQGFINYYLATTPEERIHAYSNWVEQVTNVPARLWYQTFSPITRKAWNRTDHVAVMRVAATYMMLWNQEISNHDAITFYKKIFVNVTIRTQVDGKALATFWDPDKSVINAIEQIKNNETVNQQPFTGDELLTTLMVVLQKESIEGKVEQRHRITYNNGDPVTVLMKLLRIAEGNPHAALFISRVLGVDLGIFREFFGPAHESYDTTNTGPKVFFNAKFRLSQLQIRNLTLARRGNDIIVKNFAFHLAEHQALAPIIFNDTNGNGYLDIATETVIDQRGGKLTPILSEEALYRVDLLDIGEKNYLGPVIQNDEITVGLDLGNISVALVPFDRPRDVTAFNNSYQQMRQTVNDFQLKFHFRINHTTRRADWKFDYIYGEWSDKEMLQGLSFNQMIFTTVSDHERRQIYRAVDDSNQEIDNTRNSTRFRKIRISPSPSEPFLEIDLDSIPYEWNGSGQVTEVAYGQLIPLNFAERVLGHVSSDGEALRGIISHSSRNTYLYSISYPKFSGEEIAHDPTFSVVAAQSTETISSDSDKEARAAQSPIPGFEAAFSLFSVLFLAIATISRKKRA